MYELQYMTCLLLQIVDWTRNMVRLKTHSFDKEKRPRHIHLHGARVDELA